MLNLYDTLWAGTESAYEHAIKIEAMVTDRMKAGGLEPAEENAAYLLSRHGNVGVVNIAGPLLNADHWILRLMGVSTYPAIRAAMIEAVKDGSISQILLSIDSGGGAVSGVTDTADLIRKIDGVKPVTTFAGGTMASAAYWLGATARKVYASQTSVTGSIGVLTTHVDRTAQFEKDGIKATVLRAGKYKALANPLEALSAAAREQIQSQLDAAYAIFVQYVADARNVSYADADKKMAQGREFFGAQAVDAGLLDGISTPDAVMGLLQRKK